MHGLIRRACLLFALPAAALAEPITVVTHSTGIASINPTVLYALGQQDTPAQDELPYELTLTSVFDWTGPLPAREVQASQYSGDVVVDFRIGTYTYHYAGRDWSNADLFTPFGGNGDAYGHDIWADPHPDSYGYSFHFQHTFQGPTGSLGPGGALAPRDFEGSSPGGYLNVTAYYSNDEYTFAFPMSGEIATFSVRVTSPVPEPAAFVLLGGGLLALALRRQEKRAP